MNIQAPATRATATISTSTYFRDGLYSCPAERTARMKKTAMEGMQAAVVPIILGAAVGLAKGSVQYPPCYAIVAVCLGLYLFTSVNPIVLVLIGVVSGLIVGTVYTGKEAKKHGAA